MFPCPTEITSPDSGRGGLRRAGIQSQGGNRFPGPVNRNLEGRVTLQDGPRGGGGSRAPCPTVPVSVWSTGVIGQTCVILYPMGSEPTPGVDCPTRHPRRHLRSDATVTVLTHDHHAHTRTHAHAHTRTHTYTQTHTHTHTQTHAHG